MIEREQAIKALSEEFSKMIIKTLDENLKSCINCINFENESEVCILYDQRPPAKIIAKACERWVSIKLPF